MEDPKHLTESAREADEASSKDSSEFADLPASLEGTAAEKWRIHREASRALAAMGDTMPDLEDIRRLRVDEL